MLTKLEVDGFKNLNGFVAEFGPFTCIAGENGVGKSNIFDAIEFLSRIASGPLMSAAEQIRAVGDNQGADPRSLFTVSETSSPTRVVSASSFDCFGRARHDSARRYLQLNVDALERVIAEGHYALEQSA